PPPNPPSENQNSSGQSASPEIAVARRQIAARSRAPPRSFLRCAALALRATSPSYSLKDHVRRHRKVEKIPLRHALAGFLPSKGNLHESDIAFIALRSDLIAEHRPHQLQRFRFLSYAKKINLLRRIQRWARLHRREFSAKQSKRVRNGHAQFLLRH